MFDVGMMDGGEAVPSRRRSSMGCQTHEGWGRLGYNYVRWGHELEGSGAMHAYHAVGCVARSLEGVGLDLWWEFTVEEHAPSHLLLFMIGPLNESVEAGFYMGECFCAMPWAC